MAIHVEITDRVGSIYRVHVVCQKSALRRLRPITAQESERPTNTTLLAEERYYQ